ncbi:Uncharacterized protein PECH_005235 [Penicillium ucsense]|uniref:DUF3824 domain-containing protein n=1 Tax=Penicillium ucsense TaxID=2839758 RepID=A0A8J8W822_9EURO|nr:Uncharacterized protein PECM_006331 [Penicillium ucsense]KAF7736501.1 Uncharacterized protein PECH_005235 [Penicillium ucsense]
MSYSYRERDRYEDDRPITIKRYVIPSEERDERREFKFDRDDGFGERELVIRRKVEREQPLTVARYERDVEYDPPVRRVEREYERDYYYERESTEPHGPRHYARSKTMSRDPYRRPLGSAHSHIEHSLTSSISARNAYSSPRESEYDMVRRSDAEEEPYYYHRHRRVREYDDRRSRRELSPGDSVSQASRRHRRDRDDYSSDDSMVYIRKETREYDDERPHHKLHLAEGALIGVGAAELLRNHKQREGKEVGHGMSHAVQTAGAGALGAVAANAVGQARDYYRSKSRHRHRSHSFDDGRRSHRHSRRSRSRSRSQSHSRAKTLLELGLGAAAVAAGVAALQKKKSDDRRSRSRNRSRSRSRPRGLSRGRSETVVDGKEGERKTHMVEAGLAGAAVAGLVDHARNRSRSRKGERSQSRLRKAIPVIGAGLATAAATGLYEKKKAERDAKGPADGSEERRSRSRSRSRSRAPSEAYADPSREPAGLIEYGAEPVAGRIPAEHYYGQPAGPADVYYSDGPGRHSRSRSRAGRYSSSSDSDRGARRKSKRRHSRSRDLAGAALGATGLGYAAHKFSEHRERKKAERSRSRSRTRYNDDSHRDPYEEAYDPVPYPVSPQGTHQHPADSYYPNNNYFPPPPGSSTTNLNSTPQPYNPANYPPPPGAAPPSQPYNYGVPPPEADPYAARPRRADENVSPVASSTITLPNEKAHDGLTERGATPEQSPVSPMDQQPTTASKSVSFDLDAKSKRAQSSGYQTENSKSTIDGHSSHRHSHHQHRTQQRSSTSPLEHDGNHRLSGRTHASSSSSAFPDEALSSKSQSRRSRRSLVQESHDDSDSTIDLPARFDSEGQPLPERSANSVERLEDLLEQITKVLF